MLPGAELLQTVEYGTWLSPLAAIAWGFASVGLSGCHLTSVPLLVTFLGRLRGQTLSPSKLSALVTLGISVSLVVVAAITFALGRILGDLFGLGPWLMIALLLLGGLNLLGVVEVPTFGRLDPEKARVGKKSALLSGVVLGATLGPCTFSFFAPVLALVGSDKSVLVVAASVLGFALSHLGFTWLLGIGGARLGAKIAEGSRFAKTIKIAVGLLAIGLAINLILTLP